MTIHIELTPEMEARITAEAQARGLALENYAGALLERALGEEATTARSSQQDFHRFLDRLSEGSGNSSLTETFSRDSIYGNHD